VALSFTFAEHCDWIDVVDTARVDPGICEAVILCLLTTTHDSVDACLEHGGCSVFRLLDFDKRDFFSGPSM
jgi:hypothetical protein